MTEGSVDIEQVALTLLRGDGEEYEIGEYVLAPGHSWDEPADKAAYDRWQRATLTMARLVCIAQRAGQSLPDLQAPPRPRSPEHSGATALSTEPVLLPSPPDGGAALDDLMAKEVTMFNAPDSVVELAMSIAGQSDDLDDPDMVAALQVWSTWRPQRQWWAEFYPALARPRVDYELDDRGRRRATLHWTAVPWAGYIELPYGEYVALGIDEAACSLSGVSSYPPPALPLPQVTTG